MERVLGIARDGGFVDAGKEMNFALADVAGDMIAAGDVDDGLLFYKHASEALGGILRPPFTSTTTCQLYCKAAEKLVGEGNFEKAFVLLGEAVERSVEVGGEVASCPVAGVGDFFQYLVRNMGRSVVKAANGMMEACGEPAKVKEALGKAEELLGGLEPVWKDLKVYLYTNYANVLHNAAVAMADRDPEASLECAARSMCRLARAVSARGEPQEGNGGGDAYRKKISRFINGCFAGNFWLIFGDEKSAADGLSLLVVHLLGKEMEGAPAESAAWLMRNIFRNLHQNRYLDWGEVIFKLEACFTGPAKGRPCRRRVNEVVGVIAGLFREEVDERYSLELFRRLEEEEDFKRSSRFWLAYAGHHASAGSLREAFRCLVNAFSCPETDERDLDGAAAFFEEMVGDGPGEEGEIIEAVMESEGIRKMLGGGNERVLPLLVRILEYCERYGEKGIGEIGVRERTGRREVEFWERAVRVSVGVGAVRILRGGVELLAGDRARFHEGLLVIAGDIRDLMGVMEGMRPGNDVERQIHAVLCGKLLRETAELRVLLSVDGFKESRGGDAGESKGAGLDRCREAVEGLVETAAERLHPEAVNYVRVETGSGLKRAVKAVRLGVQGSYAGKTTALVGEIGDVPEEGDSDRDDAPMHPPYADIRKVLLDEAQGELEAVLRDSFDLLIQLRARVNLAEVLSLQGKLGSRPVYDAEAIAFSVLRPADQMMRAVLYPVYRENRDPRRYFDAYCRENVDGVSCLEDKPFVVRREIRSLLPSLIYGLGYVHQKAGNLGAAGWLFTYLESYQDMEGNAIPWDDVQVMRAAVESKRYFWAAVLRLQKWYACLAAGGDTERERRMSGYALARLGELCMDGGAVTSAALYLDEALKKLETVKAPLGLVKRIEWCKGAVQRGGGSGIARIDPVALAWGSDPEEIEGVLKRMNTALRRRKAEELLVSLNLASNWLYLHAGGVTADERLEAVRSGIKEAGEWVREMRRGWTHGKLQENPGKPGVREVGDPFAAAALEGWWTAALLAERVQPIDVPVLEYKLLAVAAGDKRGERLLKDCLERACQAGRWKVLVQCCEDHFRPEAIDIGLACRMIDEIGRALEWLHLSFDRGEEDEGAYRVMERLARHVLLGVEGGGKREEILVRCFRRIDACKGMMLTAMLGALGRSDRSDARENYREELLALELEAWSISNALAEEDPGSVEPGEGASRERDAGIHVSGGKGREGDGYGRLAEILERVERLILENPSAAMVTSWEDEVLENLQRGRKSFSKRKKMVDRLAERARRKRTAIVNFLCFEKEVWAVVMYLDGGACSGRRLFLWKTVNGEGGDLRETAADINELLEPGFRDVEDFLRDRLEQAYGKLSGLFDRLQEVERLVIIPHDYIYKIPFQALWDGEEYVVQRYEVAYAASTRMLLRGKERSFGDRVAVVSYEGDGGDGESFRAEKQAILEICRERGIEVVSPGDWEDLFDEEGFRFVHLAGHGKFEPWPRCLDSNIDVGGAEPVTARELLLSGLRAGTLFLNSCETGRCSLEMGDMYGFPLTALAAGCNCILPTHPVVGEFARDFAERFYRNFFEGEGEDVVTAFAETSRSMAEEELPLSAWAPYCFIGDPLPG